MKDDIHNYLSSVMLCGTNCNKRTQTNVERTIQLKELVNKQEQKLFKVKKYAKPFLKSTFAFI